jgi:hypothetical protein
VVARVGGNAEYEYASADEALELGEVDMEPDPESERAAAV